MAPQNPDGAESVSTSGNHVDRAIADHRRIRACKTPFEEDTELVLLTNAHLAAADDLEEFPELESVADGTIWRKAASSGGPMYCDTSCSLTSG